jgi:L-asparaginase
MENPARSAARVIVTGGTFDKRYDAIKGELTFTETHLPALLEQARVNLPLAVDIRLLIDSLQMTDAHRQSVLEACRESQESAIVVVHGTDTMVETAQVVGRAALDKAVVFTGRWCRTPCRDPTRSSTSGSRSPPRSRCRPGHTWR